MFNETTTASLYECPACRKVYRHWAGHDLKCMCEALPLGRDYAGHPFDPQPFGPQRPYFHDREQKMLEFADDGREDVEDDLRYGIWIA